MARTSAAQKGLAPVNQLPASQKVLEGQRLALSGLRVSDADAGNTIMSVTLSVANGSLFIAPASGVTLMYGNEGSRVVLVGSQADINKALGSLTYTPSPFYNGTDKLTMISSDRGSTSGFEQTDSDSLAIKVLPVNDAPTASNRVLTVKEDTALVIKPAAFGFLDVDGHALAAVKIVSLPTNGTLLYKGAAIAASKVAAGFEVSANDLASGKLSFVPANNANGQGYASFEFQVRDNGGVADGGKDTSVSTYTATIHVTPVNDAPLASDDVAFASQTLAARGQVLANDSDVDGDRLRVTGIALGAETVKTTLKSVTGSTSVLGKFGSLLINADGSYSYSVDASDPDYRALMAGTATESFTYQVSDGNGTVDKAMLTITLSAGNKAPVSNNDLPAIIDMPENNKIVGLFDAQDPDGDALVYSLGGLDADAFVITAKGLLSFKTAPDFETQKTTYELLVIASDSKGGSSTQPVTIRVTNLDEGEQQIAELKAKLLKLESEFKLAADTAAAKQKAFESDIAQLKQSIDTLTQSGAAKDSDLSAAKKSLTDLQSQLDDAVKAAQTKQSELSKQIDALEASGSAKNSDIAALKSQLASDALAAALKQKSLEGQITELKASVDALTAANEAKDAEITKLKADAATAAQDAATKQASLEQDIKDLKDKVDALTASGVAKDADIEQLKSDVADLEAKAKTAAEEAAAKEATLNQQIQALEASDGAKMAEISQLKADLAASIKESAAKQLDLSAQIKTLTDSATQLQADLNAANAVIAGLRNDINTTTQAHDTAINALQAQLRTANDKVTELSTMVDQQNETIASLNATIQEVIDAATSLNTQFSSERAALEMQVDRLAAIEGAQSVVIKELKAKLESDTLAAAIKLKALDSQITELKASVDALKAANEAKDAEFAQLKADAATAAYDAATKKASLEQDIKDLKDKVDALTASGVAKDADIEQLKSDVADLEAKAKTAAEEAAAKEATLNQQIQELRDAVVSISSQLSYERAALDKQIDELLFLSGSQKADFNTLKAKIEADTLSAAATVKTLQDLVTTLTNHLIETNQIASLTDELDQLNQNIEQLAENLKVVIIGSNINDTLVGTDADDALYGLSDRDTLTGGNGADRYYGGAADDYINLTEMLPARDRIVFEAPGNLIGTDFVTGFVTGTAADAADVLDFDTFTIASAPVTPVSRAHESDLSVLTADFLDKVLTQNPDASTPLILSEGVAGDVIRLIDIAGGQNIMDEFGLSAALRQGGEYSHVDFAANSHAIVVTSQSLASGPSNVYLVRSDASGAASADLLATLFNVQIGMFTAENFTV